MRVATLLLISILGACATAPQSYDVQRTFQYSESFDEVWSAVIDTFGEMGYPIDNMERASGFITTERMAVGRGNPYSDCGQPGLMVDSDHTGRFNVVVREEGAGTSVTVNTDWQAVRSLGDNRTVVNCVSIGAFEQEFATTLSERLR